MQFTTVNSKLIDSELLNFKDLKDPFKIVTNILSLNFDDLKDPFKLDANMLRKCSIGTVWPEKNRQYLWKLPKNDGTRKMIDFVTFAKIA